MALGIAASIRQDILVPNKVISLANGWNNFYYSFLQKFIH